MRVLAISTAGYRGADDLIDSMHLLRARIFRGRWNETSKFGREGVDEFDPKRPTYILVTPSRHVVGFACLLPATGPTMILVLFPDLERTGPAAPSCSDGRKFSLLRLYLAGSGEGRGVAAHHVTLAMLVTIIEWSNGRPTVIAKSSRAPMSVSSEFSSVPVSA
jgi:N-acyl-L-homoserine lactone synthetase